MTTTLVPFVPAAPEWFNLTVGNRVYHPGYRLKVWQNGDPRFPLHNRALVDLGSVAAIQTSKSLDDISGTFSITLKDAANVGRYISEMDVVDIALAGHGVPARTVLRGIVDDVIDSGNADASGGMEDAIINGRCMGKYLQITNTFRPVWDPNTLLPTSLVFGWGASLPGVIAESNPRQIWGWLYRHFIVGQRNVVGESGIPNARFWLNYDAQRDDNGNRIGPSRFADIPNLHFPYIQFDETDMGTALKQFEILGFTEAWVDELGAIVYRPPQWDAAYTYLLSTDMLKSWEFSSSDVDLKTYVEVVPTGAPGLDSAFAQATMTGRAPIPSTYNSANHNKASEEFVIPTDATGKVTAQGLTNYWYQKQRKYGLRALQITSPLIDTLEQAQAQAQGLLRFYMRFTKTATVTIPGDPRLRIGTNVRIVGELHGRRIDRCYYINAVSHDYQEGSHYDTTLTLTHGRDPWDPAWRAIALPSADPISAALSSGAGVIAPGAKTTATITGQGRTLPPAPTIPANAPSAVGRMQSQARAIVQENLPYVWGGGHSGPLSFAPSGLPVAGYDCSGFVCAVLSGAGFVNGKPIITSPTTSGGLMSYGDPGPGRYVTIYTNASHVIIQVNGVFYGSESPTAGGPQVLAVQGAVTSLDGLPVAIRHPPGL